MKIHWRHKWKPSPAWVAYSNYYRGRPSSRFRDEVCECGATRIVDRQDGFILAYRSGSENKREMKKLAKRGTY